METGLRESAGEEAEEVKRPPCKGCGKRAPGCHGQCEEYKAFQEKWEAEKKWLAKENATVLKPNTRYRFNVTAKAWFIPKKPRKGRTME